MTTNTYSILTWARETGADYRDLLHRYDGRIAKYADGTEGARDGLSTEQALSIWREDPSLLYVELTADEHRREQEARARAEASAEG